MEHCRIFTSLSLSLFFFPGKPSWLSACVLCWEITGRVPGEEQFRRVVAPYPSPFLCGDGAARTPRLVFTKGVVSCKWASGKQVLSEESLILQFEGKTEPNCVATSRTLRLSQTHTRAHVHTCTLLYSKENILMAEIIFWIHPRESVIPKLWATWSTFLTLKDIKNRSGTGKINIYELNYIEMDF